MSGRGWGRGSGGRGRGAYYKEKYGRKREDAAPSTGEEDVEDVTYEHPKKLRSGTIDDLRRTLQRIDGAGYKAYRDIEGQYDCGDFTLAVDHVQSDPFAPPSACHAVVPPQLAAFPPELYANPIRRVALCDYLTRVFAAHARQHKLDIRTEGGGWSGPKGGELGIDAPGQHVLERTSVLVAPSGHVETRFTVALPAQGRTITGQWAAKILTESVPAAVRRCLVHARLDKAAVLAHVQSVEDQEALRAQLDAAGLVAFVRDGAILPRASGASDAPMESPPAVPFKSPPQLSRKFRLPNRGDVTGMGIPKGITLIVGGGFHGKSTLLEALELGVYNHLPGDGREFVVATPAAVKIRAEDGRSVQCVDITPFINNLPLGRRTDEFSTPDASGSTSQAANIVEALEAGATTLLIDEDTSATNFMIRDRRMQMLVNKAKEPITPFIYKAASLYADHGVSSVIVLGGSGDYFDVAHTVVMMDNYEPRDVTAEAKAIAKKLRLELADEGGKHFGHINQRAIMSLTPSSTEAKIKAKGRSEILWGDDPIDLSALAQLVETSQTRCIAHLLAPPVRNKYFAQGRTVRQILDTVESDFASAGLDASNTLRVGNVARPRRFELAAALNRVRTLRAAQKK